MAVPGDEVRGDTGAGLAWGGVVPAGGGADPAAAGIAPLVASGAVVFGATVFSGGRSASGSFFFGAGFLEGAVFFAAGAFLEDTAGLGLDSVADFAVFSLVEEGLAGDPARWDLAFLRAGGFGFADLAFSGFLGDFGGFSGDSFFCS